MYLQNYLVGKMVMGDEKAIFDAMSAMPVMLSCGINTQAEDLFTWFGIVMSKSYSTHHTCTHTCTHVDSI